MTIGPRLTIAPMRNVVLFTHEADSTDLLECGHRVSPIWRGHVHVMRRRCPACPTRLAGERAPRSRARGAE